MIKDKHYHSEPDETSQEALNQVLIAQKLWLEEAQASNMEIPEPKYRPIIYQVG